MARNYKTYKTSKNVTRKTFREDDALYAMKISDLADEIQRQNYFKFSIRTDAIAEAKKIYAESKNLIAIPMRMLDEYGRSIYLTF